MLRAPGGLDWTQLGVVDGLTAAMYRGGALLAIALVVKARGVDLQRTVDLTALLVAATLGFAGHSLLLAHVVQPSSRLAFGGALLAATALLWWLVGPARSEDELDRVGALERLGFVIGGAGAAFALENLAHHVRLLGGGMAEDDAVIGSVFLGTVAIGAAAFGVFVSAPKLRRIAPAVGLVFAAAVTLQGLAFLGGLEQDPLWRYLKRVGLDPTRIGTWRGTGWIAGSALVVSGFAAGTALSAARHPIRFASILLGAALGLVARPAAIAALTRPMTFPADATVPWAWHVALAGTIVAAAGALFVVLGAERGGARIAAALTAVVAATVVGTFPIVVWSFSPWFLVPITANLAVPSSAGLVTVEQTTDQTRIVTVDRKRVTPAANDADIDDRRILWAWSLVPRDVRTSGEARVLVIGQLTPRRADLLGRLGAGVIERTATWFDALEAVEALLFEDAESVPVGRVSPRDAKRKIANGEYDLVVSLPTHGPVLSPRTPARIAWGVVDAPILGALAVPDGTIGVAWLDANAPLVHRELGSQVLVAMERFDDATIGVVRGRVADPVDDAERAARPILFDAGPPEPRASPVALLSTKPMLRQFDLHARLFRRFATAQSGDDPVRTELARGLAIHFEAQHGSSPFETAEQATELEEDELRAFSTALRDKPVLDPFTRELWEGLAWLLTEKRMPDMVLAYLESIAEAYAPWPELDLAVGKAYHEFLQPEDALRFLERALANAPYDLATYVSCAEVATELGDHGRAAGFLRRALEIQPGRYDFRRGLGISLMKAGDPDGRRMLLELLREEPEDEFLLEQLEQGPPPPPATGEDR